MQNSTEDDHLVAFSTFLENYALRKNKLQLEKLVTYKEVRLPELTIESYQYNSVASIGSDIVKQIRAMTKNDWLWDDRTVHWSNPLKLRFVNKTELLLLVDELKEEVQP
jgi:hypothetical protein